MAKLGNVEKRLEALEAELKRVKALKARAGKQKRRVLKENEKRRIWIVGQAALAAMTNRTVRLEVAKELKKPGVLLKGDDQELFTDLLAGSYIPTSEEIEERREMTIEEPANQDGDDAAQVAAE